MLAAGRGSRMGARHTHKVCYEIVGVPAIRRLTAALREGGIHRFIVVVGHQAEQVMHCLDGEEGITYAFQAQARGTADAARIGLRVAQYFAPGSDLLIANGDKLLHPRLVQELLTTKAQDPDAKVVFAVQSEATNPDGARIAVSKDGRPLGIVERSDLALQRLAVEARAGLDPTDEEAVRRILADEGLHPRKCDSIWKRLAAGFPLPPPERELAGEQLKPDAIRASGLVNAALYLFDPEALSTTLGATNTDNAQGELYLPDAVNLLCTSGHARMVTTTRPDAIRTFSTMAELLELQALLLEETSAALPEHAGLAPAGDWLAALRYLDLGTSYGAQPELQTKRRAVLQRLLEAWIRDHGPERPVVIARAPGRINLMGRHIEHRGGSTNVMSIDREVLVAASPRDDDRVVIRNLDPAFPERDFAILEEIALYDTENWVSFIESEAIQRLVTDSRGDWVNYVRAGVLRLQLERPQRLLQGMDMLFTGNVPMAAGLSSSSAIVVAAMEAAVALNRLEVSVSDFITLAGEGEWFVGSRGGSGDHAAMKASRAGNVTHMDFFPFRVGPSYPFDERYRMLIVDSRIQAKKSAGARDLFNQQVAAYEFGLMLVRERFPVYRDRLEHLRDLNALHLGVSPERIYEILLELPEYITTTEVFEALPPELHPRIRQIVATHRDPGRRQLRSVVLYGLAECARADLAIELIAAGDYPALGRMMTLSHDGDRVARNGVPWQAPADDATLLGLIADLRSQDPVRVAAAQIDRQPGAYACSTPEIDALVDDCLRQPGVLGAQLSGAGLGGCILVLVERTAADPLIRHLDSAYYAANGLEPGARVVVPTAGSGIFAYPN
ncbi:MAG: NTP transferase domain-containing protein [Bacillota bacterium]|nr:NTP transferase domain-containing protein [Bacillota bacterium]